MRSMFCSSALFTLAMAGLSTLGCAAEESSSSELDEPEAETLDNPSTGPFGGDYVRLKAVHSGRCLDIMSASTNPEAPLQQWTCTGGGNQRFQFRHVGNGNYEIVAKHSQLCLQPRTLDAGADIVQRGCGFAASQFSATPLGLGEFRIANVVTGLVLDVAGASLINGGGVVQWGSHGGANQRFTMLPERSAADRLACVNSQANGGAPCKPDPEEYIDNVFYGYRTGKGWGSNSNVYYDALDRCSYWHDEGCWSVNLATGVDELWTGCSNTTNAITCFQQVQPASLEEEVARDAVLRSLMPIVGAICEPFALPLYPRYDPHAIKTECGTGSQASSGSHMDALTLQRWATQQGGFWQAQQWVSADFNGDGWGDLAKVFNDGYLATLDVHLAQKNGSFVMQRWATQQGAFWETQQWLAGDFDGDGFGDVAKVFNDGGLASMDVHRSNGGGFPALARWATQQGGFWDSQKWMAADMNGDGRVDLVNVFDDGGFVSIDVHRSVHNPATGVGSFVYERWATQIAPFSAADRWLVGNFDGDPSGNYDWKADVARVFGDNDRASIDVYLSNGSGLLPAARWATQQGGYWGSQKWIAGNVNARSALEKRRDNIMCVFDDAGLTTIDVHRSTGSAFVAERWATRQGQYASGQKWLLGTFNSKWEPAKVFDEGGLVTIEVHIR